MYGDCGVGELEYDVVLYSHVHCEQVRQLVFLKETLKVIVAPIFCLSFGQGIIIDSKVRVDEFEILVPLIGEKGLLRSRTKVMAGRSL